MNRKVCLGLLAAAIACAAPAALAARPLATEDADILERGSCEAEGFIAGEGTAGRPSARGWGASVGCGIGHDVQMALAYGQARSRGQRAHKVAWIGKLGLVERTGKQPTGLTLAWALGAVRAPGTSFEHELSLLNLVATRTWSEALTLHANLGWVRSEPTRTSATAWNLAADWALGPRVDLAAEVFGDDRSRPAAAVGARWKISSDFSVNGAYTVQAERPRVKSWSVGFKLGF